MRMPPLVRRSFVVLALVAGASGVHAQTSPPLTVFAAVSLKDALEEASRAFAASTGVAVRFAFAGTPALARQIENGAPADVFASADTAWMDHVAARGLIRPGTRDDLLGNTLVAVGPRGSNAAPLAFDAAAWSRALGAGRLAVADVATVPAGRYARTALTRLGLWSHVQDRLAPAENVRAALVFVARGEAPLGVVYASDARAEPGVEIVATFPADSHPPIVYPFAVLAGCVRCEDAQRFLAFLRTAEAARMFERQGFSIRERVDEAP
jgi:molybdate transport system substrate-binding protein